MSSMHHPPKVKVEAAERDMGVLALLFALGAAIVVIATLMLFFVVTLPASALG